MQVNYPNDHDFTRIVEIKHATGQRLPVTTIVREYPRGLRPRPRAVLSDPRAGRDGALRPLRRARGAGEERELRRAASPPIATTTWTRSSAWRSRSLKH